MNPNYNQTITVYNCFRGEDNPNNLKDIWQKTVLHNCFYKNVIQRVDTDESSEMRNVYTARIPESVLYRPYRTWIMLEEDERKKCFTFRLGDIVVRGECQDDILGVSPCTATEILEKYKPDSFKVTAFSDNTAHTTGKHYRIGG